MIVTRSPLRISLGGGGTDLPSYYREHGGFLIAGAIDKYVYITIHDIFVNQLILKYSKMEHVTSFAMIEHPIVREALHLAGITDIAMEITSMADIPAGTGLGSSGSFTTALLRALYAHKKQPITAHELAELACYIEINRLKDPVGKQDQFIASYGGITCFEFNKDDTVKVTPLLISKETLYNLEDNLIMVFTGFSRSASSILKDQDSKTKQHDDEMIKNLHYVKDLGYRSRDALLGGNLQQFGELMHEHWLHKRKRSQGMSNPKIDEWYQLAMENGAIGGKLIGAGGGGFLLFYTEHKRKLRQALCDKGLREVRMRFDFEGTKVVAQ